MFEWRNESFVDFADKIGPFLWTLLVIGVGIVLGLTLRFIILKIFKYYMKRSDFFLFESFLEHMPRPMLYFLPLFMISLTLPLAEVEAGYYITLTKTVEILMIISFTWILVNVVRLFEDYTYKNFDITGPDNFRQRKIRTQLSYIRRIAIVTILIVSVAIILLSFDNVRKLGAGLLTGVGIGGIIIGFAAQRSLANLLAGFQIAFTQPIRIDDVIVVENEWGRVEEITLTYVVVRIWDQRRLILPINYFIEKPFQNWTRTSAEILGTVFFYTDYSLPVEQLRTELDRLVKNHILWDGKVCGMQVTDTNAKTMEIRALMSAKDSGSAFDLRCYVRENMIKFIQENYPQSLPKVRAEFAPVTSEPKDNETLIIR